MLNQQEILELIERQGLIRDCPDAALQLTPNGFDLSAAQVFEFDSPGAVDFSNKERVIPSGREIIPQKTDPSSKHGWWVLTKGAYKVVTNEVVSLPRDLIAFAFCRSSLLRCGAFTQTAVWDAGFRGRSEFILIVENPHGIRLKQNARVAQLLFVRINETRKGYDGIYQDTK